MNNPATNIALALGVPDSARDIALALTEPDPAAAGRALHEAIDRALRAKPLNARTLAALPVGIKVWDDQIEYLTEALRDASKAGGCYQLPGSVRELFEAQRADLIRAREWLASKVAAEGGAQ